MQEKMITDGRLREQGQERAWGAILGRNQAPGIKPSDSEVEVDAGVVGARAAKNGGPGKMNFTYFISLFELSRGQSTVLCSITLIILIIMIGIWPLFLIALINPLLKYCFISHFKK